MGLNYCLPPELHEQMGNIHACLWPHLKAERQVKLESTLRLKRRDVLCVFENTHHCHNISAVLRTIEAMGFMEVLFVYHNKSMRFRSRDGVERGASQWLLARRSDSIESTAIALRNSGYKILAVSLPDFLSFQNAKSSISIKEHFFSHEIDSNHFEKWRGDSPIALIFGSELVGVSPNWIEFADGTIGIKMNGFVESLNVSVCAGMLLHCLREKGANCYGRKLAKDETTLTLEYWLARSMKNARRIFTAKCADTENYFEFIQAGRYFDPFPNARHTSL